MTQDAAPPIFILHLEGEVDVRLIRDRELAESSMEEPDLEQWRVYDVQGYRHALSARGDGAVAIGPQVGGSEMAEVLGLLRTYLEQVKPGHAWKTTSFDALLAATEQANREADAINARRSRKIVLVLALVGIPLIAWFVKRRLTAP